MLKRSYIIRNLLAQVRTTDEISETGVKYCGFSIYTLCYLVIFYTMYVCSIFNKYRYGIFRGTTFTCQYWFFFLFCSSRFVLTINELHWYVKFATLQNVLHAVFMKKIKTNIKCKLHTLCRVYLRNELGNKNWVKYKNVFVLYCGKF